MTTAMLRKMRLKSCPRCKAGDLALKEYVTRMGRVSQVDKEWVCLQCGWHEEAT